MNLFDIVKRKDRSLAIEAGEVTAVHRRFPFPSFGVTITAGGRFRLTDAHNFTALRSFPRAPGWAAHRQEGDGGAALEVWLNAHNGRRHLLHGSTSEPPPGPPNVALGWPAWAGFLEGYDLTIANVDDQPCYIATTWTFNPRLNLRPLIRGDGIEVGPGTNPFVLPDADTQVRYIEAAPLDEWIGNYGRALDPDSLKSLWASYVIGDAVKLDVIPDGALDFIFSSHVFEHLSNPLGVLDNWRRKLRPGGLVAAVIPDLRYCFDLRQPPSTLTDWASEYESGSWQLSRAKYEKWCRHTTPEATPESLITRKYSIHAHYYTSETILHLVEDVIGRGWYEGCFLNAAPNNKDFGVAFRRAAGNRPDGRLP